MIYKSKNKIIKCPRCNKEKAIIDATFGVLPGLKCQADDGKLHITESPEFYNPTKAHRVQSQRDSHGRDVLQPYAPGKDMKPNSDFVKAYPKQAKNYFSDEELQKM